MPKVFILGAGFSKALHAGMPLLNDLSRNLDWDALPAARPEHKRLGDDVEQLLSYLYQEMPWKSPEQRHFDLGLFYAIARQIAGYIADCEERAFRDNIPAWAGRFVEYLHRTQATVVTLNYDTALERLTGMLDRDVIGGRSPQAEEHIERDIVLDDIYRLPMLPLEERTRNPLGKNPTPTYRLLKPHGSINWYSFGDETGGAQVFYDGIEGFYPDISDKTAGFGLDARLRLRESNRRDLAPLIIPPVAEKSAFYRSHLVKTLWSDFSEAVQSATEIYFIGYSLPKTDLSMRLFLTAMAGDRSKAIYIVNRDGHDVKANYEPVLPGCWWRDDYLGHENAVELMVDALGEEHKRKSGVAHQVALNSGRLVRCVECGGYAVATSSKEEHEAARERTRAEVDRLFKESDPLVQPFNGDAGELLFMIRELDLNRGYSFSCGCGKLRLA